MSDVIVRSGALVALLGEWRSDAGDGLVRSLTERLRLLIIDGRVPVGARLPSERDLADRLEISRTSVTAAYAKLRQAGCATSTRGSGTRACLPSAGLALPKGEDSRRVDFSKAALPALPWLAETAREASVEWAAHLTGDGYDLVGIPQLRRAIADRYAARGLPTDADQIMVTLGAQHGIELLARTLLGRGDRAVIESPTYPHAYEALQQAGARLVATPVGSTEEPGAEVDALRQAFRRTSPAVAYLMPDFQNPTGRSFDSDARTAILAAAAREGTTVIADETTAELTIDRRFETSPMAASGDAILVGGVGKTIWGGLRIGWIRADAGLIRRLVQARVSRDLGNPVLEQVIVARLMPRMPEILELRRQQLREGRDLLAGLLTQNLPEWGMRRPDGGIAAWVSLGAPVSSQLALAVRAHGLTISAGPKFGIDGAFERFLRIPIGGSAADCAFAVDALASAWHGLPGRGIGDSENLGTIV